MLERRAPRRGYALAVRHRVWVGKCPLTPMAVEGDDPVLAPLDKGVQAGFQRALRQLGAAVVDGTVGSRTHSTHEKGAVIAAHVAVPEEDGGPRLDALRAVERAPARKVRRLAAGICAPHKLGQIDSPWHAVVATERCATKARPRCHPRRATFGVWPHPAPPWRAPLSGGESSWRVRCLEELPCRVHRRKLSAVPVRRAFVDARAGALMRAGDRGVEAAAMLETVVRLVYAPSSVAK
eukprot:scaffold7621_cov70-Phaeocystis_antarctica.AAC.2